MKKFITVFLMVVMVFSLAVKADASVVNKLEVLIHKSNKTVTLSIKNTDNKTTKKASVQLQKKSGSSWNNSGSSSSKTIKPNKTEKIKRTLGKGTYRYKVTSSGKTGYSSTVTIK